MSALRLLCCLLLLLLLPASQVGCRRSILSFVVATGGLIRPVLDFELDSGSSGNMRRIFNRIRWMEQLREWEVQLQAHSLSGWLGSSREGRIKRCTNCSLCFSGDVSVGEIAVPCWSQKDGATYEQLLNEDFLRLQLPNAGLSGLLRLEVPTLTNQGGEGFMAWDRVCFPATRYQDDKVDGLCLSGLTGYEVKLDRETNPTRQDALWVLRMTVSEGVGENLLIRRVDGVMGMLYKQREQAIGQDAIRRKAVLLDEKNAIYQNFQVSYCKPNSKVPAYRDCCGSVRILAADGAFSCAFVGFGVPAARRSSCWPSGFASLASNNLSTFEVRCRAK